MPASSRESSAGSHFYGTYRDCGRKFFLKYVLGYRPTRTAKALIFGGVMHEAIAAYYLSMQRDIEATIEFFLRELADREEEFLKEEDLITSRTLGPAYLKSWHTTWGEYDERIYDVVEVEEPYEIKLGPNEDYIFTVRLDRVMREKATKRYVVFDTKTTGWSLDGTFKSVNAMDQMTSYIWAINKVHPEWNVTDAIPDIIYGRASKVEGRAPSVKCERPGEIYRDSYSQAQFEIGIFGTILEVSQKVDNLDEYPGEMLFPRNGSTCAKFGCEYLDICRTKVDPNRVPVTFDRDPWVEDDLEDLRKIRPLEDQAPF